MNVRPRLLIKKLTPGGLCRLLKKSLILMDGQEYLVLPTASIHIQLPCHERYFETDTAVITGFLKDKALSELSLSALMLRILDIRNRVLQ